MKDTFELDQWKLWLAIQKEVARQCPDVPADERANACIDASRRVAVAYALTADEFVSLVEEKPIRSIGELLAQLRAQGCDISMSAMTVPNLSDETRHYLRDLLAGVDDELRQIDRGVTSQPDMADEVSALLEWLGEQ